MRGASRWTWSGWLFVSATALWAAAPARAATAEDLFVEGHRALASGSVREAIELHESLADRGFVHPDASYNRGLAYLARVRAHDEKPGDLGRAAAAFEECLWKRPADEDAELALESVRNEVARRLPADTGKGPLVDQGPGPRDAIAGLLPESAWAWVALLGSLLLAGSLFVRDRAADGAARSRLVASSTAILGVLVLGIAGPFASVARTLRLHTASAVVVAREARWVKEDGTLLPDAAIPEAAAVQILERRGSLLRVRWGKSQGLLRSLDVRIVRPEDAP